MLRISRLLAFHLICALFLAGLPLVGRASEAEASSVREVSIIALIANPDEFEGQKVETMGFLTNGHSEDVALYLDRQAFLNRMTFNALWVNFEEPFDAPGVRAHDLQYVRIEGVFRKGDRGAFGFYSGSLNGVQIKYSFPRHTGDLITKPPAAPQLGWPIALPVLSLVLSVVALGWALRNRVR